MKRPLKSIMQIVLLLALMGVVLAASFSANAAVATGYKGDPATNYVKQNAPYEDSSINMWFEHSFKKVFTSDKTSSGMNTYSVYMAKNEIENAQFVLYSASTKSGLSASITEFKNSSGATIPAEIYYEMYVTTSGLVDNNIYGATSASQDFIREGETPDPVVPLSCVGTFQLNAGKSQAFLIRIKSSETTPSGWYSAQLDIKNANGQIVKTATVFCYVWDFVISEKTELQTAFILSNNTSYGGSYKAFYDYLLENRLCAMDIPGELNSSNPYLQNERISAIRVTSNGGGNKNSYSDSTDSSAYRAYTDIYNDLSNSDVWEDIKDKLYFYNIDEPLPGDLLAEGSPRHDVDDATYSAGLIEKFWGEQANIVIPHGEEHYYPYSYYTKPISQYSTSVLKDSTQEMIDTESCNVWCPRLYGFTPASDIANTPYKGAENSIIRTMSGPYSGNLLYGETYYNWDKIYGEFADRIRSLMAIKNQNGEENVKFWAYSAGFNKGYSYTGHLIENTGLQTKLMFWQLYQEGLTGYLYYGTNNWSEYDQLYGTYTDTTVTGAKTNCAWKVNRYPLPQSSHYGSYLYGNGVLFYGTTMAKVQGIPVVGTLRVEIMRDGVEEYQMLSMLEDYLGATSAKSVVGRVSKSVVEYLSMPRFSRSAWDSSWSDYDIMAQVRIDLGEGLESYAKNAACDHNYKAGNVVTAATCLKVGYQKYTCTKCGVSENRVIPALHTVGTCFTVTSKTAPTCTVDGKQTSKCSVCGFVKTETLKAYHNDSDYYKYVLKNSTAHSVICTKCNVELSAEAHNSFEKDTATCAAGGRLYNVCKTCGYSEDLGETSVKPHNLVETHTAPTCTEPGVDGYACTRCSYTEGTTTKATGHKYGSDNVCTVCGDVKVIPPYVLGDINDDGQISAKDLNLIKKYLAGSGTLTENQQLAADVTEDGRIAAVDMNLISRYIAGVISEF